ncbi:MAG: Dabb family protein [Epulopiscium sp.]|nr:Dabb family protein [Candidatus Epulonipiscium sp.]
MVKHIVMWRLKDVTDFGSKEEMAKEAKARLEALKDKIEEIVSIEVGINFNSSDMAYDLVLYSEFNNKQDLDTYQVHPEHLKVAEMIKANVVSRAVVDYEI